MREMDEIDAALNTEDFWGKRLGDTCCKNGCDGRIGWELRDKNAKYFDLTCHKCGRKIDSFIKKVLK